MAKWVINDGTLSDIADAIRAKKGTSSPIGVDDLAYEVSTISGGGGEIPLRDRLIIPDKYNTGCKGEFTKFNHETDESGLVWAVDVENGLVLNFNLDHATTIKNLQPNTTVVFENLDFTNYNSVKIMNAQGCRKDSPNYVAGIKIVFKNCLFITLMANYEFATEDMISFEVYNSSFANTSWPNTKFYNCLIGNKTFYRNTYGMSILGDGAQPRSYTSFTSCYFMDIEPEVDEASSAHFDGLQTLAVETQPYARSHHLYNCRFECIDMPYSPSGGQWSYSVFWEGSNPDSSIEYCQIHGGGYYQTSIRKGEGQTLQNNFIEQSYSSPCYPRDDIYQMTDNWAEYYTNLFVSSVWLEDNEICVVCSNDIGTDKTLKVVTDTNVEYTFNIAACPTFNSQALSEITCWDDLPFDKIYRIPAYGVRSIKCYDGATEIRSWVVDASAPLPKDVLTVEDSGTYNVLDYASVVVDVPQYGKPVVPQTGGWQYKTTTQKGYIIVGKDDDPTDSAQFVRMVNGYGYPVTLNSMQQRQDVVLVGDGDTENSTYPTGSVSVFPNGCTINQLNKYVLENGKGEIALHGGDTEKIWDSSLLTGTILDDYYNTYVAGGGQKTKEELRLAIIEKYYATDVEQGAPIVAVKRTALQTALDHWIYTIGTWGGGYDFIIDDINCGGNGPVARSTQKISRAQNWMGDGILTNLISVHGNDPYWIYRNSGGLLEANIASMCDLAYDRRVCIECFHHWYIDGTTEHWNNFKNTMDILKSYVDQGKIDVVTRKQYYELGEWVAHPIVSISISLNELTFPKGETITESDFIYTANLDNGTTTRCAGDRIVDLSNIDTSTVGTYTAYLEYRGFKAQCNVVVSDVTPTHYLLEDGSFSGNSIALREDFAQFDTPITFEAGKKYRFQFDFRAETDSAYATHYIGLLIGDSYGSWRTITQSIPNIDTPSGTGITEASCIMEIEVTANYTLSYMLRTWALQNCTIGAWSVTHAYIYEVSDINYIVEDESYSGNEMVRQTNYGTLDTSIQYEAGKSYRIQFHFRAETSVQYSSHSISFTAPYGMSLYGGWRTTTTSTMTTSEGITEGDVLIDFDVKSNYTISELVACSGVGNTTVGIWTITHAYIYEIDNEETETTE